MNKRKRISIKINLLKYIYGTLASIFLLDFLREFSKHLNLEDPRIQLDVIVSDFSFSFSIFLRLKRTSIMTTSTCI